MFIHNFPENLLSDHHDWHANHGPDHGTGPFPGQPGYGDEFLKFHHDFLNSALSWIYNQNIDPVVVAPWPEIPAVLKTNLPKELADVESRIVNRPYSFNTIDELGNFLDTPPANQQASLHTWVHDNLGYLLGSTQPVWGDWSEGKLFQDIPHSPWSTFFYQWHGLIDKWRQNVQAQFVWPRRIDWDQLLSGATLALGDVIRATIEPDAAPPPQLGDPERVVEFVLTSDLPQEKQINVPDGETFSSWNIWTGLLWPWSGPRTRDSVTLWEHQVHNGQMLTFFKLVGAGASFAGLHAVYRLGGLDLLKPGDRVTFEWVSDPYVVPSPTPTPSQLPSLNVTVTPQEPWVSTGTTQVNTPVSVQINAADAASGAPVGGGTITIFNPRLAPKPPGMDVATFNAAAFPFTFPFTFRRRSFQGAGGSIAGPGGETGGFTYPYGTVDSPGFAKANIPFIWEAPE